MNDPTRQPDQDAQRRRQLAGLWVSAQPAVMAYIVAAVRDFHHSQDLLQETAEVAAERFDEYDAGRPFRAWALGIARHRVLMHFRKQKRDAGVFNGDLLDALAAAQARLAPELDPMREALHHCLKHPTERNRRVLLMRYVDDLTPAQIADRLDMKKNAVLTLLHRVRQTLAECIRHRSAITGDAR